MYNNSAWNSIPDFVFELDTFLTEFSELGLLGNSSVVWELIYWDEKLQPNCEDMFWGNMFWRNLLLQQNLSARKKSTR